MITICPACSGIDSEKLVAKFGEEKVTCTCIGECGGRDGLVIGYVNNNFVEVESEEEFIKIAEQ